MKRIVRSISACVSFVLSRSVLLTAMLVVWGWTVPGSAQTPAAPADGSGVPVAPVVIDGEVLFSIRGLSAYTAERRAAEIERSIREVANDHSIAAASLTAEEKNGETEITAGGRRVMRLFDEDAAVEAVDRQILARAYVARIVSAIDTYRVARQPGRLWRHALLALAATAGLIGAVLVWAWIDRRVRARLEQRYRATLQDVGIQSFRILKAEHLWSGLIAVLRLAWALVAAAMVLVYLRYTLHLFPWTAGAADQVVDITVGPLVSMGSGLVATIPDIVFLSILFVVTRYVLRLIRLFFDSIASGTVTLHGFERDWSAPTYRLVRLAVIAFAIVVAYPYVPGSNTEAFKGVSLFVGIVFSLGSSTLIGNIVSGYSMTYRRTFAVGDVVKLGEHTGKVIDVRLLATYLQTPRNEVVSVPNSVIVGADVVNYSALARDQGLILSATVGIGYETPWRQIEAMLLEAAARTPGVMRDRQAFVQQTALGDFAITYELNVHCDVPTRMRFVYTDLRRNILDVFNEYGIQIMTPAYEGDPQIPKVVPRDKWFTEPANPPVANERPRQPQPTK